VRQRVLADGNLEHFSHLPPAQFATHLRDLVDQILQEEGMPLPETELRRLIDQVSSETSGLGPIQPLLDDPSVTEIMINGPHRVYLERDGRLELTTIRFRDETHLRHVIDRMVEPIGRRIDESSPMADARLLDGSRVNVVVPPLARSGTEVTIRKFRQRLYTLGELANSGALGQVMAEFLEKAVAARLNILISGGTGSGKTTLLSALSEAIIPGERLCVIEDMGELRLNHVHVAYLEARPANVEGRGEVTIRHLVKNALRMRPDRIIVGEVRGSEALDMLQAMNSGHDGSMTTIHANSPADAFKRLEALVLMAEASLPVQIIREHVVSAVHLVVQTVRHPDGRRVVDAVSEVQGYADGRILLQDLFRFDPDTGTHTACGYVPACLERLRRHGQEMPGDVFRTPGGERGWSSG
jgi:pilus assembly protein CpaF